jgi:Protein of unknown function (DUF3593)/Protein of unknown function (DUF2499)
MKAMTSGRTSCLIIAISTLLLLDSPVSIESFSVSPPTLHQQFSSLSRETLLLTVLQRTMTTKTSTQIGMLPLFDSLATSYSLTASTASAVGSFGMDQNAAEALAGPFFGASLFPYLAFLYFLSRDENQCPKGVTVGFATCLLFVFLTIPAAIASKLIYGVSLADCDWLHGSAESMLTITNLVTVIAFRQALSAKEQGASIMPASATSWRPMIGLVILLTALAGVTALVPALTDPTVHTPYLGGFMDLPSTAMPTIFGAQAEPDNALTVACWIIHVSSLVEFLVAMGFCWRWADIIDNPKWKGLTWGLLPLHSSGITACTYHLFYNRIPILVPLQALLTCVGNTTAALAAYYIARSNGWSFKKIQEENNNIPFLSNLVALVEGDGDSSTTTPTSDTNKNEKSSSSLVGFEDLGDALANDNDYSFLIKLFAGCAVGSYIVKYGETFFDFPYQADLSLAIAVIGVPSALNAFKWYKRSQDASFEGWF